MDKETESESISIDSLRNGDRAEFARLVEAHSDTIYRLALRMLGNQQDAEDILQETFLKAYRHLHNFDGRSKVSTWLYRIATNEALMFLRRRRPDQVSINDPLDDGEAEQDPLQIVDWCCMPEEEMMSTEGRAQLNLALDSLPHTLRIVFLLRDIEGLSTRETAEILNLTETATKTRLSRARLRLREILSAYYGERMQGNENE